MTKPQPYDYQTVATRIADGKTIIRPENFGCITFDLETMKTEYITPENAFERDWLLNQSGIDAFPPITHLSAPEIVYWTSTYRCNYACKGCYVLGNREMINELPFSAVQRIITDLATNKVFIFAIGGGEPFLRKDLFAIAKFCRHSGIIPTVVTNGSLITEKVAEICKVFGQINVSIDGTEEYYQKVRGVNGFAVADRAVRQLLTAQNRVGINFVISETNFQNLDDFLAYTQTLQSLGNLCEVNIVMFKPFGRGATLDQNVLSRDHVNHLLVTVARLRRLYPNTPVKFWECCTNIIALDIHPLESHIIPPRSCVSGHISMCIGTGGVVSPCSYTQHIPHNIGNITQQPLKKLWSSEAMQNFRRGHLYPICQTCNAGSKCRGVCQFIPDWMIDCKFYR